MKILEKNEISYCGVGNTLEEAGESWIKWIVNEFSLVANPFDSLESFDQVSDIKKKCDCVIVLYNDGEENYRYLSSNLQRNL
jgi:hypothetical protein